MGSILPSASTAVIAIAFTLASGYSEWAENSAVLSAHNPEGYAAFSWLAPITVSPLERRTAAPTLNLEYGAYEPLVALIAFWRSSLS